MKRIRRLLLLAALCASGSVLAGAYEDAMEALERKDVGKMGSLLQRGLDVNTSDQMGNSLLLLAARNGDFPILDLLLRSRANILTINKYGDSALMLAAIRGDPRSVVALVAAGAEVAPKGWTPLIYAVFGGHSEIVRYLLTLKVDVDAQAENGLTALMAACRNGHMEIVKLLLEHHASVSLVNDAKLSAGDIAAKAGHKEIADLLARVAARKG